MAIVKTDGSLWMYGDDNIYGSANVHGELGNGTTQGVNAPFKLMDHVVQAIAGNYVTAAIKDDGTLWVWGDNEFRHLIGEDGNDFSMNYNLGGIQTTPAKILDNVCGVALGYGAQVAVKTDGSIWAWGQGSDSWYGGGNLTGWGGGVVMDENGTASGNEVRFSIQSYPVQICEGYFEIDTNPASLAKNTSAPSNPTPPEAPKAQRTSQNLAVDGVPQIAEIYNIDGANYFKLRDVAALLNGTGSQFSVDYDAATGVISVRTGEAYVPAGGELTIGADKSASAVKSSQKLQIDGKAADLDAYNLGGGNFFKFRDLGAALNFDVDWDEAAKTMLVTSR